MIRNSNDETNFPYELLLTDAKVSRILKVFPKSLSAYGKFSKAHLSKVVQSGWILLFDTLIK